MLKKENLDGRNDIVNRFEDTVHSMDDVVVLELEAEGPTRGPARVHTGVGRQSPHLREVGLGQVIEEWVAVTARSIAVGNCVMGRLPRGKGLLVPEDEAS